MSSRSNESPKRAFCELCCSEYQDIALHNKGLQHRGGVTHNCGTCNKGFSSVTALGRHHKASTCPCSPGLPILPTARPLRSRAPPPGIHLGDPAINPPPPIIPDNPEAFCTLCNKQCKSAAGLQTHIASVIHNPLTARFSCIASSSCRKSFNALSALLYHLESGSCPSKLTWKALAELVIAHDHTNNITEPDAAASRAAFAEQMMLYLGVDTDTDTDSEPDGGVTFTPPPMSRSNSTSTEGGARIFDISSEGSQTPWGNSLGSVSSDDLAALDFQPRWVEHPDSTNEREFPAWDWTPSPSEDGSEDSGVLLDLPAVTELNEFACALCSKTKKRFRTREALQTHMESQTHASKIYHCPLDLLLDSKKSKKQKGKRARKFKALSALAQHIEVGACEGEREAFAIVVGVVNGKLKEAGLREIKVAG